MREKDGRSSDRRRLAFATLAALAIAGLVLVLFVLPAEYGIDPTGVGRATGLTRINGPEDAQTDASGETPQDTTAPLVFRTYERSFPRTSTQVLRQEGYLAEGETVLLPFTLDAPNITKITMRLEFVDANSTARRPAHAARHVRDRTQGA